MKVLICGSRNFADKKLMLGVMKTLPKDTIIIEGEAMGADSLARDIALELNFVVEKFPADWDKHGKSAGPIRNQKMLIEGKPQRVLAFFYDMENSIGTWDMVRKSQKAGLTVEVFVSKEEK